MVKSRAMQNIRIDLSESYPAIEKESVGMAPEVPAPVEQDGELNAEAEPERENDVKPVLKQPARVSSSKTRSGVSSKRFQVSISGAIKSAIEIYRAQVLSETGTYVHTTDIVEDAILSYLRKKDPEYYKSIKRKLNL